MSRKDYEEEKLDQTYVPVDFAGLAPSVEEVTYEFIKLQIADLKPQEKIDLAVYCFKEAAMELKK